MSERIEGRVAQLIDDRTLVINRGSQHGVRIGMRFAVLNPRGAEIIDPDSGDTIGSVEIDKVVVKVVRVEELLAVAKTFRTLTTSIFPSLALYTGGTRRETLRSDETTYREELDPKDSYINVGDPVVQVIGEEFGSDK
jgi:hypothetical protein